jgi:protein-S-isoprenylcysteine O-methyltransferase Ste14
MIRLIGKTTIHPIIFVTGKLAGYAIWIIPLVLISGFDVVHSTAPELLKNISLMLYALGFLVAVVSLFNLGRSTSLGLPLEKTTLRTGGLYRFSRNPIYVGLDMLTISSIVYTLNPIILALGVYSLIIHHFIIRGEERFLSQRFKEPYSEYCKKVRR